MPTSWLCDGADDCRDNSDEQNCPTTNNASHESNEERSDTISHNNEENVPFEEDGVVRDRHPGIPHRPYDGTVNDPKIAGPSLNDPSLLESANGETFVNPVEVSRLNKFSKLENPDTEISDKTMSDSSRKSHTRSKYHQDGKTVVERINENENEHSEASEIQHPVLQGSRPFTDKPADKDQYPEYSIRDDRFQNHPIPDVDYPAKETFSVDSTSSVNENYHHILEKKDGDDFGRDTSEYSLADKNNDETVRHNDKHHARTPSQRLRERLNSDTRIQKRPIIPVNKSVRPTSVASEEQSDSETVSTTKRPTRPPSRLENFQERFQEWRDQRRPTVPSDLPNLQTRRVSQTRGTVPTNRAYDLIRRRPLGRSTTPLPELPEVNEKKTNSNLISESVPEEMVDKTEQNRLLVNPTTIKISKPNDALSEHIAQILHNKENTSYQRTPNIRTPFRMRQAQRRQNHDQTNKEDSDTLIKDNSNFDNFHHKTRTHDRSEEVNSDSSVSPIQENTFDDKTHDEEHSQILPEEIISSRTDEINISNDQVHSPSHPEDSVDRLLYNEEQRLIQEPFKQSELNEEEANIDPSVREESDPQYDEYDEEYGTNYENSYESPDDRPSRSYDDGTYDETANSDHPQVERRISNYGPDNEEDSQLNIPNHFRVSFPHPRINRDGLLEQDEHAPADSFIHREDAIVSDLYHDVPEVHADERYPIYNEAPTRSDKFAKPYSRRRPT